MLHIVNRKEFCTCQPCGRGSAGTTSKNNKNQLTLSLDSVGHSCGGKLISMRPLLILILCGWRSLTNAMKALQSLNLLRRQATFPRMGSGWLWMLMGTMFLPTIIFVWPVKRKRCLRVRYQYRTQSPLQAQLEYLPSSQRAPPLKAQLECLPNSLHQKHQRANQRRLNLHH